MTANADGSWIVTLGFPVTAKTRNYTIWLPKAQKVGSANVNGSLNKSWGVMKVMGWGTKGGSGRFYMGAP